MPSKTGVCFPQSCGSPIIKLLWPQGQIPQGFLVPLLDSQAGKPDVGFRTFTTVGELLWYCSPVCGSPTWQIRDWNLSWLCPSYVIAAVSSLSLDVGYLSFMGSSILLLMVVQQLVAILVLLREEMSTRPSTPPSWTGSPSLWVELLSFLSLSYKVSLYILDINLLSNIQLAKNLSPFCGLFFHSPDSVHWGTNI